MLPIAVEIAPPDAHREEVAALLTACTRAAADAECVLAAEAPEGGAAAVAIVTWQSDGQAFVEVGMRREGRPEWRSRSVDFASEDERIERWRTVGFVVGTLARSALSGETAPDSTLPPKPPPEKPVPKPPVVAEVPKPEPVSSPPKPAARAAIDIGAELGPGLESGWRTGGVLRTRWPFQDPLRVLVSLKYMQQNGATPDGRWFTLGAGLGWVHGNAHAEIAAGGEARIEYFEAKYDKYYTAMPTTIRESRWIGGLGLNASAAWMPMPVLGLYVAGDAAWMFGSTNIHLPPVDGVPQVVTDGALRFGVGGGVRLRLW